MLYSSCNKSGESNCLKSTGEIVSETRNSKPFHNIILKDNVNIILQKSDTFGIVVEAGKNIISGIVTNIVSSGTLEIRNDNDCNWIRSYDKPVNVYLNYIDIDSIDYQSIGDVSTLNTITTDTLVITAYEGAGNINIDIDVSTLFCSLHYGTLDIIINGNSGVSYIYSASFGLIDTQNCSSNFMYVTNRSSNNVYVNSTTYLWASIENIGNIYYKGNPTDVVFEQSGKGELIKLPN